MCKIKKLKHGFCVLLVKKERKKESKRERSKKEVCHYENTPIQIY